MLFTVSMSFAVGLACAFTKGIEYNLPQSFFFSFYIKLNKDLYFFIAFFDEKKEV